MLPSDERNVGPGPVLQKPK